MKEQIKEILREVFEFGRESNHGEPHYDRTADQILALTDEKVKAERDKWVKAIDETVKDPYTTQDEIEFLLKLKRQVLNETFWEWFGLGFDYHVPITIHNLMTICIPELQKRGWCIEITCFECSGYKVVAHRIEPIASVYADGKDLDQVLRQAIEKVVENG